MKQRFGSLFLIVGILLAACGGLIGLPFSAVYLLGFIGTGGREAGTELFATASCTVVVLSLGWLLVRLGQTLRQR
jgi:uncharacterized membrane protein YbhN (UPF0104 family)